MNKKGIAIGLIAMVLVAFITAFLGLIALTMWLEVEDTIQAMPNETVSQFTKDRIDGLNRFNDWGDKIFSTLMIILLIGFLISSATLPAEHPLYLIIYLGVMVLTVIVAMILGNTWEYLADFSIFSESIAELGFTTWFMRYFPVFVVLTGAVGGIIFYSRKAEVGDRYSVD